MLRSFIVCVLGLLCLHDASASCKYKGKQICDGAVTNEYKKSVRICTEGKILRKSREEVEPGYPLAGGGEISIMKEMIFVTKIFLECVWYGEILCDGAVVQVKSYT